MNLFLFLILGVDSQMCGIFVGFFFFFAPGSAPDCLWGFFLACLSFQMTVYIKAFVQYS